MITYNKPGTQQYRQGEASDAEFLKQFGWEPVEEIKAPTKKTVKLQQPAVEEEVVNETKGE
jgi:hypothetical protein